MKNITQKINTLLRESARNIIGLIGNAPLPRGMMLPDTDDLDPDHMRSCFLDLMESLESIAPLRELASLPDDLTCD